MTETSEDWPDEGDLVVCSVKSVKENGAYLDLDGYPGREGFVFIGEIATGWVRNIRAHVREGQRIVAKVIGIKRDRDSITLSIKSVSEERRRGALQSWKNEQRATQIMKVAADRINWKKEDLSTISEEMKEALSQMETEISLVQVFQTMIASKEECPAEITTMLQN